MKQLIDYICEAASKPHIYDIECERAHKLYASNKFNTVRDIAKYYYSHEVFSDKELTEKISVRNIENEPLFKLDPKSLLIFNKSYECSDIHYDRFKNFNDMLKRFEIPKNEVDDYVILEAHFLHGKNILKNYYSLYKYLRIKYILFDKDYEKELKSVKVGFIKYDEGSKMCWTPFFIIKKEELKGFKFLNYQKHDMAPEYMANIMTELEPPFYDKKIGVVNFLSDVYGVPNYIVRGDD